MIEIPTAELGAFGHNDNHETIRQVVNDKLGAHIPLFDGTVGHHIVIHNLLREAFDSGPPDLDAYNNGHLEEHNEIHRVVNALMKESQ